MMAKRGRKIIKVDWAKVDAMCKIQCTAEEICGLLDISEDTLTRRCKEEFDENFAEYSAKKRQGGKASLRRMQWQQAEKNPAMAIFLGKNLLNQSDKQHLEIDAKIEQSIDLSKLETDDLLQYQKLTKLARGESD